MIAFRSLEPKRLEPKWLARDLADPRHPKGTSVGQAHRMAQSRASTAPSLRSSRSRSLGSTSRPSSRASTDSQGMIVGINEITGDITYYDSERARIEADQDWRHTNVIAKSIAPGMASEIPREPWQGSFQAMLATPYNYPEMIRNECTARSATLTRMGARMTKQANTPRKKQLFARSASAAWTHGP